jgi:hypothetical protein
MTRAQKGLLVAGGYAGAVLAAWITVKLYVLATNGSDRDASAGMYAFGDSLVFAGAFTLAAVPATGLGLYFLRSSPRFWSTISVIAVAIAITALAAMVSYFLPQANASNWSSLAPLRILAAPLFGVIFLLALIFAPPSPSRRRLLAATAMEFVAFAVVAFIWWFSLRS